MMSRQPSPVENGANSDELGSTDEEDRTTDSSSLWYEEFFMYKE